MFGFITMLISTLGATGMGSILKIIGGVIDRIASVKEAQEKREMLREMNQREIDINFQKAVFNQGEGGMFARGTRRLIAVIGMLNFATISILSILFPGAQLVTFVPPEHISKFSFLWGFISIPMSQNETVVITTGHLALVSLTILGAIIGFYFTPGGRR